MTTRKIISLIIPLILIIGCMIARATIETIAVVLLIDVVYSLRQISYLLTERLKSHARIDPNPLHDL